MTYSVTLERGSDGSYLAWVHELPGCFARAKTRGAVLADVAAEVARFRDWLRAADEAVEDGDGRMQNGREPRGRSPGRRERRRAVSYGMSSCTFRRSLRTLTLRSDHTQRPVLDPLNEGTFALFGADALMM